MSSPSSKIPPGPCVCAIGTLLPGHSSSILSLCACVSSVQSRVYLPIYPRPCAYTRLRQTLACVVFLEQSGPRALYRTRTAATLLESHCARGWTTHPHDKVVREVVVIQIRR